jgi:cytochrome c oxidase subunit 3
VFSQLQGYLGEDGLADRGSHLTGSGILVSDGKYGTYFSIKQDGEFIDVDGNDYMKLGKVLTEDEMQSLKDYTKQFLEPSVKEQFKVKDDGIHTLYWENKEMSIVDGVLQSKDTLQMESTDRVRLYYMSQHIQDDRGHFFMRGKIGKDFHIYYKGVEMTYENGDVLYKGGELEEYMQLKAFESADTASSYLWAITIAHLLHIIVTLLYMMRLVIRSFSGKINQDNTVHLRMGAVFWHFLGFLWLFLLLFLLFIH